VITVNEIVKQLASLGLPGSILLILGVASAGSNATIVAVLTAAGGPFGIVGGIGLLGLTKVVADLIADYGIEAILKAVYSERSKYETLRSLLYEIQDLPICEELKMNFQNHLKLESKNYLPSLRTVNISFVKIENSQILD
jgi:hypothetical protein